MSLFDDVEGFVRETKRTTSMVELGGLLSAAVRTIGFDHVALVQHVRFATPLSGREGVQFIDYPDAWRSVIRERGYYADDPVLTACQTSAAAFLWSEVPSLLDLTPRQYEILETAGRCGIGEGFTVPINVPGQFLGSCSFAMRWGREAPRSGLPAAQYVGCFAFEAARRIGERAAREAETPPKLTQRQFDCLVLAAQGRSDWHIAQLLGISRDTVHQHIETAKRRYGVASRTQLVVRALFDSQLTFADVLNPSPD